MEEQLSRAWCLAGECGTPSLPCPPDGDHLPTEALLGCSPAQLVDLEGACVVVQQQVGNLLGHQVGDAQLLQHIGQPVGGLSGLCLHGHWKHLRRRERDQDDSQAGKE